MATRKAPSLATLLKLAEAEDKPVALVLAGHNGSGKSTLWYDRPADALQIPLVKADRLTPSRLPPVEDKQKLEAVGSTAARFRSAVEEAI